jgi:Protein of unknown function (DUF3761)
MSKFLNRAELISKSLLIIALSAASVAVCPAIADTPPPGTSSTEKPTTCKDGTQSASTGRGACSGHGGVDQAAADKTAKRAPMAEPSAMDATTAPKTDDGAAPKKPVQTPPAKTNDAATPEVAALGATTDSSVNAVRKPTTEGNTEATGATAKCGDGTYSKAKTRQGACSKHGGVSQWMGT